MKKRFLALALGTLAFGVTLGGVKMGLGHQDALMVKAEDAETAFSTLTFSSKTNSKGVSGYTTSWTCTANNETVFSVTNFNNNNNSWTYVKCGRNGNASVASIATVAALDKAVAKVAVTFDKVNATNVNSIKLVAASDAEFTNLVETVQLNDVSIGDKEFSLSKPAPNLYYKIIFDCASGSANGFVQISKVEFFESTSAEPASPVKSISAGLANPNAVFYVGDKVTLDDFVITATHEDTTESVLKTGVTIENPDLVEGANVLNFVYGSGETERRCQFTVKAIKGNFYSKSVDASSIAVGKKIMIANSDGSFVLGAQKEKNRSGVANGKATDRLVENSEFASLLVLPTSKSGTFALYDEVSKGVLYAADSSSNLLKTETDFNNIDENSFAKMTCVDSAWKVQFTGKNTRNILRFNPNKPNSPLFSCYSSGQQPVSIYVSSDAPVTFGTETWAEIFLAKLNEICDPTGNTALTEAKWSEAEATFDALSIPDKMAIKYGNFEGEKMKQALAGYDFIIKTKYAALHDFLGRRTTTKANALMLPGATDSTTWTLVGIGAVTIAASASLLFFRRKKSN